MRKFTILILALLTIPLAEAAGAPAPGAMVMADQAAEADWLVWEGRDDLKWYFAGAMRGVNSSGAYTIGYAGKGDCEVSRDKQGTLVMCMAESRGRSLELDEFEFDPAMSSARLSFRHDGFKHSVAWESADSPYGQGGVAGGDGFVGTSASLSRAAVASGSVMGRKFAKRSKSTNAFAGLGQGATVMLFTDYKRTVRVDDNGIVHIRATFRVDR